ncbi:putative uncharacterized protein [Prevotella sp. CAG:1185]|uniref:DUF4491 family protein n=1 Tax=uncultured Prevotella sp. TaxID=159272 RepID=UPI000335B556|nr:DUF4491 family protein [uncultured Prevotella sp.]CCY83838.1 putative uncharacterized protein [Prevotella sp. CAG:1185]
MHFSGIIIAISCFLIIGIFHPIVIKTEYYTGTRFWWIFLIIGLISLLSALFIANSLYSAILGIFGASSLWSIKELFEQCDRVKKGWFPMNPKRKNEYSK